jgi:hypothetical protein
MASGPLYGGSDAMSFFSSENGSAPDLSSRKVHLRNARSLPNKLRLEYRGNRPKFVFATHNANIPVLDEAEMVGACEFERGALAVVAGSTGAPVIQDKIISVMEGGRDSILPRLFVQCPSNARRGGFYDAAISFGLRVSGADRVVAGNRPATPRSFVRKNERTAHQGGCFVFGGSSAAMDSPAGLI